MVRTIGAMALCAGCGPLAPHAAAAQALGSRNKPIAIVIPISPGPAPASRSGGGGMVGDKAQRLSRTAGGV